MLAKLDRHVVPGGLYDAPAMLDDLGVNQRSPVTLELSIPVFLPRQRPSCDCSKRHQPPGLL
jgi:hypothetical protein